MQTSSFGEAVRNGKNVMKCYFLRFLLQMILTVIIYCIWGKYSFGL